MKLTSVNWKMKDLWFLLFLLLVLPSRSAWGQVDLSGEWSPNTYNDHRDIADYTGIPLNEAGRLRAESWSPDEVDLPENVCRPHPADIGFRVAPSEVDISKEINRATQQLIAYHLHTYWSDQTVWMDGRPRPSASAAHKWSGFSTGHWEGNTLVYTTDHLKEGYLTRTGVVRSDQATVTTRINRYGNYLTMTFIIYDPAYLTERYIREASWVYAPNQVITPHACEPAPEGAILPAGSVPNFLPGKNGALTEFAVEYGIPLEAALGGAETTYPEYIKKMKTLKTAPHTTKEHYLRNG
jgi:hypothetical protein